MKIAILDDYQDAVRKLDCFQLLADQDVKVFNNTVRGLGQLASRLTRFIRFGEESLTGNEGHAGCRLDNSFHHKPERARQ